MQTALRSARVVGPRLTTTVAPTSWALLAVNAAFLTSLLVLFLTFQSSSKAMHSGEVAGTTVVAQRRVTYVDHAATKAKRTQAMQTVNPVYRFDPTLARERAHEARIFLNSAFRVISSPLTITQKVTAVQKLLAADVANGQLQQLPTLAIPDFQVVQAHSMQLLNQALSWRFDTNEATTTKIVLLSMVSSKVTLPQRSAIGEVLGMFMAPTLVPDAGATRVRQRAAAAAVAPVTNTIYEGEVVIRRGDLITPAVMERLTAIGVQNRRIGWQEVVAAALFAVIIIVMLFWYLIAFHPDIVANRRLILLLDVSILGTVLGAKLLASGHVLLPYFFPVAAVGTFAAVLIAPEACVAFTLAMALLAGWVVANSFELSVYYLLTGTAGILAIRRVHRIKQFVLAGMTISAFGFLTVLAFGLATRTYDLAALQEFALAGLFNGFVSAILALGGFALLSDFFGVTTTLQLLELGHPNQPLLRRLMVKAPGTYNHSLIVASMVERAAEEIGADSLAAKIGALYHDVGKTTNPLAFVENQLGMGNLHDDLHPTESAQLIRGHVAHGLRLASQHRLPRLVADAIGEHHGTMTIAYFLHRARQERGPEAIDSTLFSYPGPKPQSKETALLMLADGCEAAVRAAQDHSAGAIEEIVDRIFDERIQQGQLDECLLTFGDLRRVRIVFCSILNGLYHPRVEYPGAPHATWRQHLPLAAAGTETYDRP